MGELNWFEHKKEIANQTDVGYGVRESQLGFLRRVFNCPLYVDVQENRRYNYAPTELAAANIIRDVPSTDI